MHDELVNRLKIAAEWAGKGFCITPNLCLEAVNAIEELTGRNVGKWLKVNGYAIALTSDDEQITMPTHKCSACGKPSLNVFYTNFCPNCGAKMIGGDDDA